MGRAAWGCALFWIAVVLQINVTCTSAHWDSAAAVWCGPRSWLWHHCTAWWGCRLEAWSGRSRPAASPSRSTTWGSRSECGTRPDTATCCPLEEDKRERQQRFRLPNPPFERPKLETWDQALGELTGVHFVVELVLGRTQVAQIFGYFGSLRDEGVLLLAQPAFHCKPTALVEHGGKPLAR